MKRGLLCAAMLLALCATSCRRNENNLYPLSGKITYKGAPAAGAVVFFNRQSRESINEQIVMAIVQSDGSFEAVCGPWGKGAPPGQYDVLVEWKSVVAQRDGSPQRGPDKLDGRYADPQRPLLHATVEAKNNDLPPFELK